MDQFPSNSRLPSSPIDKVAVVPPVDRPILESVVTGKVTVRKKSLGRRLKETFFNGDSTSVFGYLLKDVLVPALQDMATDMVKQGIERAVYGEVRSPRRSGGSSMPRTHISYDRSSIVSRAPVRGSGEYRPRARQSQAATFQVDEVVFDSQIQAQIVVDKLYEIVEEYGMATVSNLKELYGETPVHTDNNWGWTDLTRMTVRRVREGWLLILPDVEDVR